MTDTERVAQYAIHFLAVLVVLRAVYIVARTLIATHRERRAIQAVARELDGDAPATIAGPPPTPLRRRSRYHPACVQCGDHPTSCGWLCEACAARP